jgi:teichuronic acid biosynthesis glycosyltransferase TuaC
MSNEDVDRLSILSVATVYPNPSEPGLGLFVQARLLGLSKLANLQVLAPVPVLDYRRLAKRLPPKQAIPPARRDGSIVTYHPRWLYPPGGTPLNIICLAMRLLWPALQLRRDSGFEVLDAHFGYPDGVAAALLSKLLARPFVVTFRGNEIKFGSSAFRLRCMEFAVKHAARVICVSEELRRFAISIGAHPDRVKTISNGIDVRTFYPRDRAATRGLRGVPVEKKVVLSAGELVERKGHHLAVIALENLRRENIDAELWIAGAIGRDGPGYEGVLRGLIGRLGLDNQVRLVGQVSPGQLAELMSASDVLCLASNLEGCPNVVNEAFGCGTPVVATSVGAIPEMIPSDRYGFKVPVGDQAALNSALAMALTTCWDRGAIAAWAQMRSWDTVAREVLEEIRQVRVETRDGRVHA